MHDQLIDLLLTGTTDTLIMVGVSNRCLFNWLTNGGSVSQYV